MIGIRLTQKQEKRDLHIKQALACIDFSKTSVGPVVPVTESTNPVLREKFLPPNILLRGVSAVTRRLKSARMTSRVCWYASMDKVS